jgi:hypothetical protein
VPKFVTGVIASTALLGAALFAPAAQAAPCDGVGTQQPFLTWHDSADYVLVDGGDFETGAAGWTLEGGATTGPGGNSLRPESSANSLSLPGGASATSPAICVSKGNPTARLFTQSSALAKVKTKVKVQVVYLNADGSVRKVKKAGDLKAGRAWSPTRKFSLAQGQFGAHPKPPDDPNGQANGQGNGNAGGNGNGTIDPGTGSGDDPTVAPPEAPSAQIALRFTARGGAVRIDDVFVDPRLRL